jgi:hypothetical protein
MLLFLDAAVIIGLNLPGFIATLCYALLALAYSAWLKRILMLDVIVIANRRFWHCQRNDFDPGSHLYIDSEIVAELYRAPWILCLACLILGCGLGRLWVLANRGLMTTTR